MNKTNRLLLVAFFAQLLLIMGMRLDTDEVANMKPAKVFEGLDPAKVTRLRIAGEPKDPEDPKSPAQPIVELAKDGTQWGIASAEAYPADNTKVEELLDKLAKLKSRGTVLTKATYHKKLEVAADDYQRKITLTVDGKELTFFLGSSPSFKNVHLRKDGSDDVVQAGELTTWEAGTRAWDWVDRAYVKHSEKDVWGLTIQNKNGTMRLDRGADGAWAVQGITEPLKKSVVDDLVRKSSSMNLEEPIGKTEKPEYGLAAPLATITLTTGTSTIAGKLPDTTKTDTIAIGAKSDSDNRYYVKASTSPYVVQVASWAVEPLINKGPKDLVEDKKPEPAKGAPVAPKK